MTYFPNFVPGNLYGELDLFVRTWCAKLMYYVYSGQTRILSEILSSFNLSWRHYRNEYFDFFYITLGNEDVIKYNINEHAMENFTGMIEARVEFERFVDLGKLVLVPYTLHEDFSWLPIVNEAFKHL